MTIDFISFFLILIISLYIPLAFSFSINSIYPNSVYFEICIDVWFLFEIFMNFFTAYYDRGYLIVNKKEIAIKYAKSWFFLDLLSSFPYSFFSLAEHSTSGFDVAE